jgi:L-asparaginase II
LAHRFIGKLATMAYPLSASAQAWQAQVRECVNRPLRVGGMGQWDSEMQRTTLARRVGKCGFQGVVRA